MKILFFTLISLVSSLSLASGFVCQGQGYTVKLYNEVQPSLGTSNPAVLVVASQQGTIARIEGMNIEKYMSNDTVSYQGRTNALDTGRFISVSLEVVKQETASGPYAGMHFAHLTVNADNGNWTANLACQAYLKN